MRFVVTTTEAVVDLLSMVVTLLAIIALIADSNAAGNLAGTSART
jgi:hypothetical protein